MCLLKFKALSTSSIYIGLQQGFLLALKNAVYIKWFFEKPPHTFGLYIYLSLSITQHIDFWRTTPFNHKCLLLSYNFASFEVKGKWEFPYTLEAKLVMWLPYMGIAFTTSLFSSQTKQYFGVLKLDHYFKNYCLNVFL